MSAAPISDAELKRTIAAIGKCGGVVSKAAEALGISENTIRSRVRIARNRKLSVPTSPYSPEGRARPSTVVDHEKRANELQARVDRLIAARKVPVQPKPRPRPKCGREDTILIIRPDVHGCHQDPEAVGAYLDAVRRLKPHAFIGLGDLGDCGGFLAQHHTMGFVAETEYTFEEDDEAANRFLDAEDEALGAVEFKKDLSGNHDDRPEKWAITVSLRNRRDAAYLLKGIDRPTVYRMAARGRTWIRTTDKSDGLPMGHIAYGRCWYTHGHHIGKKAAGDAVRAYGTNIVFGHTHRMQDDITRTGEGKVIGGWTVGHLSRNMPYWQHGKPNGWVHGFAVQIHARSGLFQHINVPIVNGVAVCPELKL